MKLSSLATLRLKAPLPLLARCALHRYLPAAACPSPCDKGSPRGTHTSTRVQTYTKVAPQVNEFVEKASPVVKGTLDEINKVATPAAKEFSTKALPQVTVRRRIARASFRGGCSAHGARPDHKLRGTPTAGEHTRAAQVVWCGRGHA